MRQLLLLVSAILVGTYCFATTLPSGLSSAWKTYQAISAKQDKNGITMVYGGADISRRPTIVAHTATA